MSRDLGRLGEAYFLKLCNEVGLKANKSGDNDSTGWDYVVELPDETNKLSVLNTLEKDFSKTICKVQIKSSDGRPGKHNIRLSSMKRFSNEVTPAFFVFFEFNKKNEPEKMFIVHMGLELIGKTLKRLREKDIKNEKNIHQKTLSVIYGPTEETAPISGLALKNEIKKHIGTNTHVYVQQKINIINSVGFDGGRISVSFKASGEEKIESMVNSLLGYKTYTDVENMTVSEIRFGLAKELSKQSEARIFLGPSSSPEVVSLVSLGENDNEIARIKATVFSPGMILPAIPDKFKKVRFKSKHAEVVMNVHTYEANMKLNIPIDRDAIELFECYEEMNFFFSCVQTQKIGIERKGEEIHPLNFNVSSSDLNEDAKQLHDLLGRTVELLKWNGIPQCSCPISYLELQKLPIFLSSHSIRPIKDTQLTTVLIDKGEFKDLNKVSIIFTFKINFHEWFLGTSLAFTGDTILTNSKGKEKVVISNPRVISQQVIKKKSSISSETLKGLENKVRAEVDAMGYDSIIQKDK